MPRICASASARSHGVAKARPAVLPVQNLGFHLDGAVVCWCPPVPRASTIRQQARLFTPPDGHVSAQLPLALHADVRQRCLCSQACLAIQPCALISLWSVDNDLCHRMPSHGSGREVKRTRCTDSIGFWAHDAQKPRTIRASHAENRPSPPRKSTFTTRSFSIQQRPYASSHLSTSRHTLCSPELALSSTNQPVWRFATHTRQAGSSSLTGRCSRPAVRRASPEPSVRPGTRVESALATVAGADAPT